MQPSTKIREALQAKRQEAQQAWAVFEPFQKGIATGEFDPVKHKEEFAKANEASTAYQKVSGEYKELEEQYHKALDMDGLSAPDGKSPFERKADQGAEDQALTAGDRVVTSEAYKELRDSGTLGRQNAAFRLDVKAMSREEHIAALQSRYALKSLLRSPGDPADTLLRPQRLPGYLDLLQAPLKLRNLITVGATDNNTVEWVRQTEVAANAREVSQSSATTGDSGTKPESSLGFDLQNTPVQTIAHWIPATRSALADIAQLRTIIDSQLMDGVGRRLNTQILKGDGNAPNLSGILAEPIQDQDDQINSVSVVKIERVLAAITKIRLAFLEPSAILMHPNDYQAVRLAKDGFGQYLFGPPSQVGEARLWGIPIVEDVTVDEGQPIVGDWSQAILYVREDVSVLASDSHSDFFVRNMIVVLAEGRYALAVPRPAAFCTVDFSTADPEA